MKKTLGNFATLNKRLLLICLISTLLIKQVKLIKDDDHCTERDPQGKCTKCSEGYFINKKALCEKCSDFCKECQTEETCQACFDGFFLSLGRCEFCSKECKTCTGYHNCLSCHDTKELKDGICEERILANVWWFAGGIFVICLGCISITIWNKIKKKREEKDEGKDSVIYDEDGDARFGNIPYKYSNRKRGLTIGEQYTSIGGTKNPSAVLNPQFVPGRESYKTIDRTTMRPKDRKYEMDDISEMSDTDGSITIGV